MQPTKHDGDNRHGHRTLNTTTGRGADDQSVRVARGDGVDDEGERRVRQGRREQHRAKGRLNPFRVGGARDRDAAEGPARADKNHNQRRRRRGVARVAGVGDQMDERHLPGERVHEYDAAE